MKAAAVALCALSVVVGGQGYVNLDPARRAAKQTKAKIEGWADRPPQQRGEPPYKPPKGWVYNTKGSPVEGKINVHLVPHTHDDTGWQITVDQYFYQRVYFIIDTVVTRLLENPDRKFIYVETGFFARWWDEQPETKKNVTRELVKSGRLEFINGGWCMHDEAGPNYVEMVDQTTRGHQWLKKNFGDYAFPKGTWQIDPFGHSNTNAWLIGAESGMEFEFWGRMDYQDFNSRVNKSKLEWIWQGSQSLGASAQAFVGELFGTGRGGYGTWFDFDGGDPNQQIQDDPSRHDYNIDKVIDRFVQNARTQAARTRTEHQMWACGSDFNYQNADRWFHNLDKLIHYTNLNGSVNVFYSTPSIYVEQKKKANLTWEVRQDDIFPLADDDHEYWTGYFTSRPALKKQVHFASNFMNAARQMEVLSGVTKANITKPTTRPAPPLGGSWTDSLEGTIGVTTHHDGMSGTERQDVADDYEVRISESHGEVEQGVGLSFGKLMGTNGHEFDHCNCNAVGGDNCLNISMCSVLASASAFSMAAWNPLARSSNQTIRLPVTGSSWRVESPHGDVASQTTEIDKRTLSLPLLYLNSFNMTPSQIAAKQAELSNKATHILSFRVQLPAFGYSNFNVTKVSVASAGAPKVSKKVDASPVTENMNIENEHYNIEFDSTTGMTTTLTNKRTSKTVPFDVEVGWYNSSTGGCTHDEGVVPGHECKPQASGAYMFRSNTSTVFFPGQYQVPELRVVKGDVVSEVYQKWSDWATLVYRLWAKEKHVEVEWTVGPIPVDTPWMEPVIEDMPNKWGKEVIVRYSTGLKTKGVFYTDSNAREMVKRQYNARGPSYPPLLVNEPVAGNYYPVNAMIAVQEQNETQLAVLVDMSQGGSSQKDGSVELMVHRRVQMDDSRGVQEPLNETMCGCNDINALPGKMGAHGHEGDGGCACEGLTMRGRHWLMLDTVEEVNTARRQAMEELSFPATLAFNVKNPSAAGRQYASFVSEELPKEIKLMTLTSNYASMNDGQLLLRVAHLYSVGESEVHSVPVLVDFKKVFGAQGFQIVSMKETQLTGTRSIAEVDAAKFKWKTTDVTGGAVQAQIDEHKSYEKRFPLDPDNLTVTVRPMEVRTFLVRFQR